MFLGVELVESSATPSLVPATALAERVLYKYAFAHEALTKHVELSVPLLCVCSCRLREAPHRIIISSDGPDDNVLKFKPPMCFSFADAQLLADALDNVLTELTA